MFYNFPVHCHLHLIFQQWQNVFRIFLVTYILSCFFPLWLAFHPDNVAFVGCLFPICCITEQWGLGATSLGSYYSKSQFCGDIIYLLSKFWLSGHWKKIIMCQLTGILCAKMYHDLMAKNWASDKYWWIEIERKWVGGVQHCMHNHNVISMAMLAERIVCY